MDTNDKTVYVNNKLNKYILIFSFLIGILLLIAAVIITDNVITIVINQFTQLEAATPLNLFFIFYTDLFIYIFIITEYVLALLSFFNIKKLAFLEKWRPALIASVASWALVEYLTDGIKVIIRRERPITDPPSTDFESLFDPKDYIDSYSFPSGHSSSAFASGMPMMFKSPKISQKIIFILYAALMAFSRVYVGVHWTTDVLVGSMLGIAIALIISILYPKIVNRFEKKKQGELVIWIIAAIAGILWLIIFEFL